MSDKEANFEKALDKIFDVESKEDLEKIKNLPTYDTKVPEEKKNDIDFIRANLYKLSDRGMEALEHIAMLSRDMESPRGYEVVTQLLRTISEVNKDLLNIQKTDVEIKKLEGEEKKSTPCEQEHLLLTTNQLQKIIKQNGKVTAIEALPLQVSQE